jgi:NAD(P)H dehydrogenase (quinone)
MNATQPLTVLVVYYSRFGVVRALAERIAEGAGQVRSVQTELLEVADEPVGQLRPGETQDELALRRATIANRLAAADALVVGAPSYFGGPASPVKRLFEDCAVAEYPPLHDRSRPWYGQTYRDKVGAAFAASATTHGGNEETLRAILTMLMHLGMVIVTPGQQAPQLEQDVAPYGATAIAGADGTRLPDAHEQEQALALGRRVAEVTIWLHVGRSQWEKWCGAPTAALVGALEEVRGTDFLRSRR